ncbi:response regulator transcription factor [Paenibacillus alginolyticus]|uniref:Response regulator n=1 Tax=Paenibacillus alginolyticus TaxID=59839 RepID=A0ABT4GN90_9BACL|nr:response regulator [Paenibacillus alginolyticus]MCY9697693.1 response regulator [Paenibacillus alginolyticus]MEC0146747.1 response regulator [Paenibacillus alginolyticus]
MNKIKTIIVDDETRIHRGIERMVRASGDDWKIVGIFSDGIEVIEFLQTNQIRIDVLITDVKMPEIDGLTLIKKIKEMLGDHTFYSIIVSGYDDFQYVQTAIREGAFDYILKPIDRTQFYELLQRVKHKIIEEAHTRHKWNDMQKKAERLTTAKQTQLLSEAVSSEPEDISTMYWTKDFPDGLYQLMYVNTYEFPMKTREYSPDDWGIMAYAIENIINEVVTQGVGTQECHMGWWWRGRRFHFWVLLVRSNQEADCCSAAGEKFANDLRRSINQYSPFSVSIAISDPFHDLSILPIMKKQLLSLMRFRMLYGGNQVFSSRLTSESGFKNEKPFISPGLKELAGQLTSTLGRCAITEVDKLLSSFFKEMTKLSSPSGMLSVIHYLIFEMYGVCMENMESGIFLGELDDVFEAIKAESNLNRLKEQVKQIVFQVHQKLLNYKVDNVQVPVVKAKAWIHENLDQKISVKLISDQVYMNPTYFCEYFKNQTSETVLDYVTRIRLEKAKELLLNTDLKIGEISERVGYQDTKYFSRLFKQKWGILPSKYKAT